MGGGEGKRGRGEEGSRKEIRKGMGKWEELANDDLQLSIPNDNNNFLYPR